MVEKREISRPLQIKLDIFIIGSFKYFINVIIYKIYICMHCIYNPHVLLYIVFNIYIYKYIYIYIYILNIILFNYNVNDVYTLYY